jgi:hypothetical protein
LDSILPAIISALICSSSALTEAGISVISLGNINVPWASNGKPAQAEASELVALRGGAAETARLSAIASEKYNLYGSTAWMRAPKPLTRAQLANANRLSAIAGEQYNLYGSTAWTQAPELDLSQSQLADSARLTALAIHFGKPPA